MTSSIYPLTVALSTTPIDLASNIFSSNIPITANLVSPGGGGTVRFSFSFELESAPAVVSVFNNDIFKGNLNADNSSDILTDGYYRFDIDVESGDNINLQSSKQIITVNFARAHLVQFGA